MALIERTAADRGARVPGVDPSSPTARSLALIRACGLAPADPIISVGDLDLHLVTGLVGAGYRDVTILHPSVESLEEMRAALGDLPWDVILMEANALQFDPDRRYALWHDRGYFDSLTHPDDRQLYVETVQEALRPDGHLVISAYGPEPPELGGPMPATRYSAEQLAATLGRQFELAEHGVAMHPAWGGKTQQLLHCRFNRRVPRWPP